jgi:hypothetical protein
MIAPRSLKQLTPIVRGPVLLLCERDHLSFGVGGHRLKIRETGADAYFLYQRRRILSPLFSREIIDNETVAISDQEFFGNPPPTFALNAGWMQGSCRRRLPITGTQFCRGAFKRRLRIESELTAWASAVGALALLAGDDAAEAELGEVFGDRATMVRWSTYMRAAPKTKARRGEHK